MTNFSYNVNDVAELNGKAVFITNSSFTDTELSFANKTGMMLIEVDKEDSLSILLYKKNRIKTPLSKVKHLKEFENFIKNVFNPIKIKGLKKLSAGKIEKITDNILADFDSSIVKNYNRYDLNDLIEYMQSKYAIRVEFEQKTSQSADNDIVGCYNVELNTIVIDNSLLHSPRLGFVLTHEFGHAFLHKKIKINNELYNKFKDSEYNFISDRHLLTNYKHWIEWQANKFASCLLMPSINLRIHLALFQKSIGISKYGHIYIDDQPINIHDYNRIMGYLTNHFNTSKTSLRFRMEELGLITFGDKELSYSSELRNIFYD